jgi:diamine N-acetyltransferase
MHPNPTIRAAQAADAHCLAVLATQVWLHTYATDGISQDIADYTLTQLTPDKYLSVLGDSSSHVWVAECSGNLIGLAVIQFRVQCPASSSSSTELQTLYVQEHFVGQGVGRLLLQAAEEETRRRAQTVLWLTANARNAHALAFYKHCGYAQIGTSYFALGDTQHENHVLLGPEA